MREPPAHRDEQEFAPSVAPGWASWNDMSPEVEFCEFAALLARMMAPAFVIETGVGQGFTTRRVARHGLVYAFEADDDFRAALTGIALPCQLSAEPTPHTFASCPLALLDSNEPWRERELCPLGRDRTGGCCRTRPRHRQRPPRGQPPCEGAPRRRAAGPARGLPEEPPRLVAGIQAVIAAVYNSRDEGDIVECSIRHMLAEGVDLILLSDQSTPGEGTVETLRELEAETGQVRVYPNDDPCWFQEETMNELAEMAAREDADWIIPADIDEFWYAEDGRTIAEVLPLVLHEKQSATRYLHQSWDQRQLDPQPPHLGKVAFKWQPDRTVTTGNHAVRGEGTPETGVLGIRELHLRSFEHFKAKMKDRAQRLDPKRRAEGAGYHFTRLEGLTEEQLEQEWQEWLAVPTVYDPIPSRSPCRPRSPS